MKSVLVIGAGIGGIATAGRLAQAGYEVTVLEQNDRPGGRCNKLELGEHRFDVGPSLFLMPEVFAQTYEDLGERMADHLDLRRIDPTYHLHFQDGTTLLLSGDLHRLQTQLEAIEPGSFGGLLRYLVEGRRHYELSLERFVGRNFYTFFDEFNPANLPLLFQLKALVKHYDYIGNFFSDPKLKAAFTFQNMYLGLSPYEAPATYSLLQYTELADGVWFPVGGMYRIVESLVEIAEAHGATFVYDAPVEEIEVEDGRAVGVLLDSGERVAADVVIANADLPYVYDQLLPDEDLAERVMEKEFTCSAIMFYWGVTARYPELAHHNVFLSGDYKASFDEIFKGHTLPEEPSFYIHVPNRTDPAAAPETGDTVMVLVPVGSMRDELADQDWEALRARARRTVIERLEGIGVTGLEASIAHEVSYIPPDWREQFSLARGAAFGLGHNFTQVGYLRPHNRHSRYENVYFCGASTHPGTGVPLVLLSAGLIEERILAEQPPAR